MGRVRDLSRVMSLPMRLILTITCLATGCITDDGDIDLVCDEIPAPCAWEDTPEDTGDDASDLDDTGSDAL